MLHSSLVSKYYGEKLPYAISFVSNIDLPESAYISRLKIFHLKVDQIRFGKRAHKRPASDRLDFWVAPEGFDRANPHYHGFLAMPVKGRGFDLHTPPERCIETLSRTWSAVMPSGSLDVKAAYDPAGWEAYCSKEGSLATSHRSIWSLGHFLKP